MVNIYDYEGRVPLMQRPLEGVFPALTGNFSGADRTERSLLMGNALILKEDADYYLGDHPKALEDYHQAAIALQTGGAESPADPRLLERQSWAYYNVASTLAEMKQAPRALADIELAVALADLMLVFEKSPRAWHIHSIVHMERAVELGALHRHAQAIAEGNAAIAEFKADAARAPNDFEAARAVPVNMRPLGEIYWDAGRRPEACAIFARTSVKWEELSRTRGVTGFDLSNELGILHKLMRRCSAI